MKFEEKKIHEKFLRKSRSLFESITKKKVHTHCVHWQWQLQFGTQHHCLCTCARQPHQADFSEHIVSDLCSHFWFPENMSSVYHVRARFVGYYSSIRIIVDTTWRSCNSKQMA